ncbi:MAG: class II aldolase/adducin family protein [Dehalococcoidia bacterium]|nr:class II aldolase/adducin family protein [Dehalococcoidia bacterium]
MTDVESLKRDVASASRIVYREGLAEGFGHVSARIPGTNTFLIPRRMSPALVTPEDLLTFDLDGRQVGGDRIANAETALHTRLYVNRPDVNAQAHTHSPNVIVLGVCGQLVRPLHNSGAAFHAGVGFYKTAGLVVTNEQGDAVAAALGNKRAVMLRGHGASIVGPSMKICMLWALILEEAARYQVMASSVGKPQFFDEADLKDADGDFFVTPGAESQVERGWNYYVSRIDPF